MTILDLQGHALSGATGAARDAFEEGSHAFRCFIGDPVASAQRAINLAPAMPMAHALLAWLFLLSTETGAQAPARAALDAARRLQVDEREALHLRAIGQLLAGEWHAAGRTLEDLSIRWPLDTLALQAGQQIDFFTGRSRMLRDRIARAMPAWKDPGRPARHAVLGMLAFGLEETGDYTRAERLGREAVGLERRDGWAWHAVAHVLEMQDRRRDGLHWLRDDMPAWRDESFLAVHNAWHLALFHLGLGEVDAALALLDDEILAGASPVVVNLIDASALLWRLQLQGVDVGDRWAAVADRWAPQAEGGHYAFNDMHAMMAFASTGRDADARQLLEAQQRALASGGDNATFLRDVGLGATQAMLDFARSRYADCVEHLRRVRPLAQHFGGSHAQRDLLDLTLAEAATRDGQTRLADALRGERAWRH